jgi:ubiquinone/menaquinone biosynthesis C-methylase UbiE
MENHEILKNARTGFNEALLKTNYADIHYDADHLELILNLIPIHSNQNYLDLGTGNGYIAFALAEQSETINVYGIDLAEKAIQRNQKTASTKSLANLKFDSYKGLDFPYGPGFFNCIVTRYAIHHFPDIQKTINQLYELLTKDGIFIICDPTPFPQDTDKIIDEFMKLKNDGHVSFYRESEYDLLLTKAGFTKELSLKSSITFPRTADSRYENLHKKYKEALDTYKFELRDNKVFISLEVLNLVYRKE